MEAPLIRTVRGSVDKRRNYTALWGNFYGRESKVSALSGSAYEPCGEKSPKTRKIRDFVGSATHHTFQILESCDRRHQTRCLGPWIRVTTREI
jgi:hypothetical protein